MKKLSIIKATSALLCVTALSSCGLITVNYPKKDKDTEKVTEKAETEAVTEAEESYIKIKRDSSTRANEYLKTVPDEDYGGAMIRVASVMTAITDETEGIQVLSKAVAKRNSLVEKKLNIDIVSVSCDESELHEELSASVKSGMNYADLVIIPQSTLSFYFQSGLLFNLRSLPSMELDKPYFNQSAIESASVGYSSFAVAGDATAVPDSLYVMFAATDRLKSLGLSAPYAQARNGTWTWDEYYKLTADVGDYTKLTLGDCGDASVDAAYYCIGGRFISAGLMNNATVAVTTEMSEPLCDIIKTAFTDEKAITNEWGNAQAFKDSAVFMIDTLDRTESIYQNGFRFGFLPLPKAKAEDEYITLASADSLFMAVPTTVSSDERIVTVISAFCAASADRIPVAFAEYLQNTAIQDNGSGVMTDIIMKNIRYDFLHTVAVLFPEAKSASNYAVRNTVLYGEDLTYQLDRTVPEAERILKEAYPMG